MENEVRIRAAAADDAPGIGRLARELIRWEHSINPEIGEPTPWAGSPTEIRRQMEQPGTMFILAERKGVIVGYVKAVIHDQGKRRSLVRRLFELLGRRPRPNFSASGGLIPGIFVCAEERGAGLGQQLSRAAEEWLRSQGVSRVYIHVLQKNDQALSFWDGNGYAPVTIVLGKSLD
ncbi:MAG: GNAT family N-acetyltransferase [Acidobacteriota bacterium]